jgi:twitching motility protein PilT
MINTPTVMKLIEEGHSGQVLAAINEGGYWGMQSMNSSLLQHFKDGEIDEKTAIAYAGNATEMRQSIRRISQAKITTTATTG